MRHSKKTFLLVLLLGMILVIVSAVYLDQSANVQKMSAFEKVEAVVSKQTQVNASQSTARFIWIENGYSISVPATDSFYIRKQNGPALEPDAVPRLFEREISSIKDVLGDESFALNEENSSKDFSDRTFYDYVQAYQKGNELCMLKINPDDVGYYQLDFSCGDSLQQAYEEQLPFLEVLGLKDKHATVTVQNQKGEYYEIGIGNVRAGSDAVIKREDGVYRVLYIGQEAPSCNLIEKEQIPSEVLRSMGGDRVCQ